MNRTMEARMIRTANSDAARTISVPRRLFWMFIVGIASLAVYMVIDIRGLMEIQLYDDIASFALGLVLADLLLGALYTSRFSGKIQAAKARLLHGGIKSE